MIHCYDNKFLSNKRSKFSVCHTAEFYIMQSEYGKTTSAFDLGFAEFKVRKLKNVRGKIN